MSEALVTEAPVDLHEQAVQRIKKRRDFHAHLFVYVLINAVVWGVWAVIGATAGTWWPWPVFVTFGWGIGVAMNAWDVYVRRPITERDIEQEMQELRHRTG